jgi:Protein of unknown function (DUF2971)
MTCPVHLYKYCNAKVAKIILATGCLRLSSPALFNDPFDCYFAPAFSSVTRGASEYRKRLNANLDGSETLPPDSPAAFALAPFLQMAVRVPAEGRTRANASSQARVIAIAKNANRGWQRWWETYVPRLRVLCLCEEVSNPLLWSHYADCHRGVAFEFNTSAHTDALFIDMKPVKYRRRPPRIYSRRDLAESALKIKELPDLADRALPLVTTKAEQWNYEREWRSVFVEECVDAQKLFSDRPFEPASLCKVFLGCHISSRNREAIKKLAGNFSRVAVEEAYKTPARFGLAFRPLR